MTSLAAHRKLLGLVVAVFGAGTFFMPMVVVDRPGIDRLEWSPFDIARGIYEEQLPLRGGHLDWGPGGLLDIALIYVLLPLSALALYLPGPPKVLRVLSAIGFVVSFEAKWWRSAFLWLFGYFGHMQSWHMRRGVTWWVLPFLMPILLLLTFSKGPESDETPAVDSDNHYPNL